MIASYKAQFKPNPVNKGYLFSSSDYGSGVPCSTEKYQSYVAEFEQFLTKKVRFMQFWLLFIIILFVDINILSSLFEDTEFLKQWEGSLKTIGIICIVLPLIFIYKQGWTLYKKPIKELGENTQPVKKRQSSSEIRDKRLKGMPSGIPITGMFLSLIGLYFSFTGKGYESPYMPYFFAAMFLGLSMMAILKLIAHIKDKNALKQQNSLVNENNNKKWK